MASIAVGEMIKSSLAQMELHLLALGLNLSLLFSISGGMQELNGANLSYDMKRRIRIYSDPVPWPSQSSALASEMILNKVLNMSLSFHIFLCILSPDFIS